MVGFQTKLKHAEQARRLPHDPGPREGASSPGSAACTATPSSTRRSLLDGTLRLKAMPRLRFAGQITGCEGYVESAAIGCSPAVSPRPKRLGEASSSRRPPRRFGALLGHITGGHLGRRRAGQAFVPADEREFRPVPAGRGVGRSAAASVVRRALATRPSQRTRDFAPRAGDSSTAWLSRALADRQTADGERRVADVRRPALRRGLAAASRSACRSARARIVRPS